MAVYFQVKSTAKFEKDLKDLPKGMQTRVGKLLARLTEGTSSGLDIKKLTFAKRGTFRLRLGDYRIRFDMRGRVITLYTVKHRKDSYRE